MSIDMIIVMEQHANMLKSFGVGAIALAVLFGLMAALVAFGGGRDHS